MLKVVYALVPGVVVYIWFFGWGIVVHGALAIAAALIAEASVLRLRGKPIRRFLWDGSAIVSALLLVLALPPLVPWWLSVIGVCFAIVVAKHLYGGLGHNLFNPAMAGYVLLLICFPREMTFWPRMDIDFWDSLGWIFAGTASIGAFDTLTGATPLDLMKTQLALRPTTTGALDGAAFDQLRARGWGWLGIGFLVGGLWLIYKRAITWHVPAAVLGSLFSVALVFHMLDAQSYPTPMFHIVNGGAILGAFFIATDPVSGAATPLGRLIFGASVGVITYTIRTWGGYPEGFAFAVLLMNIVVPTIDHYTQPRVYGHSRR